MKIYYCDCCGEEITQGLLPSFNKLLYTYHTSFLVDGYHNTSVMLHLHRRCLKEIEAGTKEPKPIREVINLSFHDDDHGYDRED